MACKCGASSGCKCEKKCICGENYGIDCPVHIHCEQCGLEFLQNAITSGALNWCECFLSASFTNSEPNQLISNGGATSRNGNFQECELPLATVPLVLSHPNIEFGSTHAQSPDIETSESSMSDTSDCRTTENNQDEQIDYLPIISSEETKLVTEETVFVVEELPQNPSHARALDTETSESSRSDISDCLTTGNQEEQIDYLPIICSEETKLVTEETVLVVEELPQNPSHAQALDTETSESYRSDISDCLTTGNQEEQIDYLQIICSEETKLVTEETVFVVEELPQNPSPTQSLDIETSESSRSDISDCLTTGNQEEQIDYLPIICSEETKLITKEPVLVVEEKLPQNSSPTQSLDIETSECSVPDISGSGAAVKNLTEQMDYLKVISTEETGLVVKETIELVAEENPLNPLPAQSHTETSESSMTAISGCRPKVKNRGKQMGNLPTNQSSEETGLDAEETEFIQSLNILNDDQISHNPVNSEDRAKYYMSILYQNIKKESLDASNSRSETNNAEKNTSITQASSSGSGRGVSGLPQFPFHGVVAARPNLGTSPFPGGSHDSTTNQPFMCVPTVSVRQKFASLPPVTSGQSAKPPFYTDCATRRLQGHFSESAQNKLPTKPAFSKSSNILSIPITPASKYAMSKGLKPRESGNVLRPTGRTFDWLKKMTSAPDNTDLPQDDSTCSGLSPSSSPPPEELVKDATELQNKTKSDKDTNVTEPQSAVVASDESLSSFACSETTAHQGLACSEDTSPTDSENKIVEQSKVSEESPDACTDAICNLSTSPEKNLNIEETELKEQIHDSSKNS